MIPRSMVTRSRVRAHSQRAFSRSYITLTAEPRRPDARQRLLARGYAVRVEDRVDVTQRREQGSQGLHVADLGRVPVLRELILGRAAVGDDVGTVLGEGTGDVLEQPGAIPRVDRDLD